MAIKNRIVDIGVSQNKDKSITHIRFSDINIFTTIALSKSELKNLKEQLNNIE